MVPRDSPHAQNQLPGLFPDEGNLFLEHFVKVRLKHLAKFKKHKDRNVSGQ